MSQVDSSTVRGGLAEFQQPSRVRSVWELAATLVPLIAFWVATYVCVERGLWWGLLFTIPAAFFMVRLFLVQHDCGHHALFRTPSVNTWVGRVAGVLTMTPYEYWRRTHAMHHATSGNLDRRWLGAIETLTVSEYEALPPAKRLGYQLYRHPLVMLGLGPGYMFVLQHRLPIGLMKEGWAWRSVLGNNLGLAALAVPLFLVGSPTAILLTHLPIVVLAATLGVFLFYVQHQYDGAYWARNGAWTPDDAALKGSSHLDLPEPLRWLTANVGAHHVHHASSRIPFYRLQDVMRRRSSFRDAPRIRLHEAFSALRLSLWDEDAGRLVSFREARRRRFAAA